ncbi:MAG TPA: hypothetical protein VFL80_11465 [Thermoanaerobaculia bacterium]|nr:hypothetical protein [Thermoanaerobaculia bacterium]
MLLHTLVLIHICGATVALLAGFLSLFFRKGSGLHRASGQLFFLSMIAMCTTAVILAGFLRPNAGNAMAGMLTLYLVVTGWVAGRRRERRTGAFDVTALLFVSLVALASFSWGFEAGSSPRGMKDAYPAPMFFFFGSIAFAFAVSDLRTLRRGGVEGARRIARHVLRTCLALLMAVLSFYPGQAKFFPGLRGNAFVFLPHLFLIGTMIYWLVRMRRRRKSEERDRVAMPASFGFDERRSGLAA